MTNPTSVYDKNLYAYCDNNPVIRIDDGGYCWWEPLLWGVFSASLEIISCVLSNQEIDGYDVVEAFVTGAFGSISLRANVFWAGVDGVCTTIRELYNGNTFGNLLSKGVINFTSSLLTINNSCKYFNLEIDKIAETVVDITIGVGTKLSSSALSTLVPEPIRGTNTSKKMSDNYYEYKKRILHEAIFRYE